MNRERRAAYEIAVPSRCRARAGNRSFGSLRIVGLELVISGGLAMAGLAAAGPALAPPGGRVSSAGQVPASPTAREPQLNVDDYTSARVCGECHQDIYKTWRNSLHAASISDPIFDTAFMQAVKAGGEEARRLCLRCHAPMTIFNQDSKLELGVTREGVSCDFCHTVKAVNFENPSQPFVLDVGPVKRSVIKNADSPAHEVAFSDLHLKSELCGGCHDYTAPKGGAMMSTYTEWKQGPYSKEGIQCQNCHMVLGAGKVVREDVKTSGDEIHLHSLIHDSKQIRSALKVQLLGAERSGDSLRVDVEVENVGSGHMVPTGLPSREILLTVKVEADRRTQVQQRRYRKVVVDENRRPLTEDYEILLYGARILNDNRIAPREKRRERLNFTVAKSGSAKVTATLSYRYVPRVLDQRALDIELGQVEKQVY